MKTVLALKGLNNQNLKCDPYNIELMNKILMVFNVIYIWLELMIGCVCVCVCVCVIVYVDNNIVFIHFTRLTLKVRY